MENSNQYIDKSEYISGSFSDTFGNNFCADLDYNPAATCASVLGESTTWDRLSSYNTDCNGYSCILPSSQTYISPFHVKKGLTTTQSSPSSFLAALASVANVAS